MMTAFFLFLFGSDGKLMTATTHLHVHCVFLFFYTGANWQAGMGPTHERNPRESEHLTFYIQP